MKRGILFILSLALVIFVSTLSYARSGKSLVGKKPPEIKATSWLNTTPLSLAGLKGKVVVVEFWATWCPPCRSSIPHLIKLYNANKSKGLVLISLTNEKKREIRSFVRKNKMTYPIGAGSSTSNLYGVSGIPHAVVIGRDGKVVWEGHPMSGLDGAVKKALSSK